MLSLDPLISVFNAIVRPHIDYCLPIWGNTSNQNLVKIQTLINRAMRIILGCPYRTPTSFLLNSLSRLNLKNLNNLLTACTVFKSIHNLNPSLSNLFTLNIDRHAPKTRGTTALNLFVPRGKSNYFKNTLTYRGAVIWNTLPLNAKQEMNYITFKKITLKHLQSEQGFV